ncbi:MAG: carboxypeptidase-like regulatory domain-containing protein, partial [Bacteroidales bacterium]|nr:carboxypeptidase-like regulatory domain-containing protein [Bacteroidales bacterium]
MKTKLTASIIGLLLCMPLCYAQQTIRLSGTVLEADSRQAAMYANIVLQTADSAFVAGASTNDKGAFRIDKISEGDYRLIVSAVGFKTNAIDLQGLSRSTDLGEILLEEATQQLDEVTVSAANVVSKFDRKLVFPNKQQVSASNNGVDLLRNLMLPRLRVNPMDGSVLLNDGNSVQLCINGRKVSKEEIQALLPGDVIRIEYIE